MPDSDDVLHRTQQAARLAGEVARTADQVRAGDFSAPQGAQAANTVSQLVRSEELARVSQVAQQVVGVAESIPGGGQALEALSGMGPAILGQQPVEKVRFTFKSSAAPEGAWRVVELHAREGLSELYACTLELANEDLGAEVDTLLGSSAEILISRAGTSRRLCGVVHRVEHTGVKAGHLLARVHVVPALWALSLRRNCCIFQELTVPKILEKVLAKGLEPFGRSFRIEVNREYLPREYCVQYHETDLDFVLRLMEEEGIFFFFDHSGEKEELVLAEENEQCPSCQPVNGGSITVMGPEAATAQDEALRHFDFALRLHTTSVVVRDFNWTHPDYSLTRESRGKDARGLEREVYEYPAPLLGPYDAGAKKYKYEPAQKQEELRRRAFEVEGKRGQGAGYVSGFTAGHSFELTGHGSAALDQWYLLTRVEHFGCAPEELTSDTHAPPSEGAPRERYRNTFEAIPLDVPYRPSRQRTRARMAGLQTATVVGPANEEIFTDEHGRIKVKFHWDREEKKDETCSCFLRVGQVWAGQHWGFLFLPRIGMEVLVDFLEGDPDRPLVVGCVYNGQNPPPYTLPEQRTRSSIRTSSTPGGEGFNELRFEDAKDAEEVFLHAQKDFNEVVLNNHSTQVKANQTNSVDVNQTETVGGDQAMSVKGKRTKTVDKDETTTVHGNRTETVDKNEKITITGTRTEDVTGQEKLNLHSGRDATVNTLEKLLVTGHREETIQGNDKLGVTEHKVEQVTKSYVMTAHEGEVGITLNDRVALEGTSHPITLHNSSGQVVFHENKIEVTAQSELSLVCGAASIKLKSDGTIEINGAKEVSLGAQQSTLKLEAAGGTLSAPKLTSSATGIHEITGALIKIN